MNDRVNETIVRALRREETRLQEQIYDPDKGLKVKAAKIRARSRQAEDELAEAMWDLKEVAKEIERRT